MEARATADDVTREIETYVLPLDEANPGELKNRSQDFEKRYFTEKFGLQYTDLTKDAKQYRDLSQRFTHALTGRKFRLKSWSHDSLPERLRKGVLMASTFGLWQEYYN